MGNVGTDFSLMDKKIVLLVFKDVKDVLMHKPVIYVMILSLLHHMGVGVPQDFMLMGLYALHALHNVKTVLQKINVHHVKTHTRYPKENVVKALRLECFSAS